MNRMLAAAVLIATSAAGQAAHATPADIAMFGTAPVGDDLLAANRGGQSPFAPLSKRMFSGIAEDGSRADTRQLAGIGRTEMDVWWGTVGSELIAQSVRRNGVF